MIYKSKHSILLAVLFLVSCNSGFSNSEAKQNYETCKYEVRLASKLFTRTTGYKHDDFYSKIEDFRCECKAKGYASVLNSEEFQILNLEYKAMIEDARKAADKAVLSKISKVDMSSKRSSKRKSKLSSSANDLKDKVSKTCNEVTKTYKWPMKNPPEMPY